MEGIKLNSKNDCTAGKMTRNQKWTIASTAAGFSLENMDIMFLSFALTPIIASLHISQGAAGLESKHSVTPFLSLHLQPAQCSLPIRYP